MRFPSTEFYLKVRAQAGEGDSPKRETDESTGLALEEAPPGEPGKYACVLLNDDYSPMEFVIEVLQKFFKKTHDESMKLMLKVHHEGRAVAGVYPFEIAETKANQVVTAARAAGHPLQCIVEPMGE